MSKYSNQKKNLNEEIILNSLNLFINISTDLLLFEKIIYSQAHLLNRSVFKTFRKIREQIENLYSHISNFNSQNTLFNKEKQKILEKQIQAMQSNFNIQEPNQNQKNKDKLQKNNRNQNTSRVLLDSNNHKENEYINFLQQQIEVLKSQLRRNDTEYQIQIKKYNIKYEEMLDEINYYRQQLEKQNELEDIIEKLEVQLKVLEEVKHRDQQLIQNMAKKIRNLQKQKYGHINLANPKQQMIHGSPRINPIYSPKSRIYSKLQ